MADTGGHWATTQLPDGSTRQDWVPDRQPPPPADAPPGAWQIVRDEPEAPSRWEWHPMAAAAPAAKAVPLRWSLTAAAAGTAMLLTFVAITVFGGGSDSPAEAVAADAVTDQPLATDSGDRDNGAAGDRTDDRRPSSSTGSTGSTPGATKDGSTPRTAPTTWAQEVAAAGPNESIRLTPQDSDWTAENIVIGKDLAGKFLGRATVRYSGPGSARGTFAVTVLKDGKELTTLTGELVEVRSGVYQVMLSTAASWVDGPWTTEFKVLSTT